MRGTILSNANSAGVARRHRSRALTHKNPLHATRGVIPPFLGVTKALHPVTNTVTIGDGIIVDSIHIGDGIIG